MFTPPGSPRTPTGSPNHYVPSYRQRVPPELIRRRPVSRQLDLSDSNVSSINLLNDGPVERPEYTITDNQEIANRPFKYFNQDCVICMEPLTGDICEIGNCRHTFHCSCISEWRNHKNTCPSCKQPIDIIVRKNESVEIPKENSFGKHRKMKVKQLLADLKYIIKLKK
jgi:hypothetical protein